MMSRILLIFLVFALVHSITVSPWFKGLCERSFGRTFMQAWYRFLFTLLSIITAGAAASCVIQVPDQVIWEGPAWFTGTLRGVQAGGLVFGALSFRHLDGMEFMGFRQAWRYLRSGEVSGNIEGMTGQGLVTAGVYGIVRHPLYVAGIIIFTFSPRITVNGLAITALADLYFLFGMFIEERRFLGLFGDQYREYMRTVPRMLPRLRRRAA